VKEDGELLQRGSHVVGEQSLSPIRRIFLLPEALGDDELEALKPLDRDEKIRRLEAQSIRVGISPEARTALENSDIIVYGSGTQHSSLYPSYMTSGIREAIEESAAPVKALLVNIGKDHDIQSLCATDIVDGALDYLGDPDNAHGSISHILCSSPVAGESTDDRLPCDYEGRCYHGAPWLVESLQNSNIPGIHSGLAVAESLLSLHAQARSNSTNQVEVFVALNERSFAADLLVQEFLDLPWKKICERSCLTVAGAKPLTAKLPEHVAVEQCDASGVFPEVAVFSEWLYKGDAEYLVTLTGDGIYRLKDIFMGVRFLNGASFGAVFGSRNQQRKQFFTSLHSAYGESKTLYGLSWLASFLVGAAFSIRYQMFFSDPLTGFRIYKRAHIAQRLKGQAAASGLRTPSDITKLLIHSSIDIAEVPVGYRTFKGFTNMRWRILRGARNAWSVIF
jgi:hypothetical protein